MSFPDYMELHIQNSNLHSHCCGESKNLPYIKQANFPQIVGGTVKKQDRKFTYNVT